MIAVESAPLTMREKLDDFAVQSHPPIKPPPTAVPSELVETNPPNLPGMLSTTMSPSLDVEKVIDGLIPDNKLSALATACWG